MTAEPIQDPVPGQPETAPASTEPEPATEQATDATANATVEAAAVPPVDAVVTTDALAAVAEAPAVVRPSRRPVVIAVLRRAFIFALTVVLFVGGVTLGVTTFQRTRPVPVGVDGAIAVTDPPPAVAQEFIAALGANDSDAMRSSLGEAPNKDLTNEFTRFDIKKVKSVDTLGTAVDGSRSATEVLLHAEKSDGLPFEVNLVILVDGGTIEGFR
jgi:hypothetical protein